MPPTNDFQPNNVWGSNSPTGASEELTLPSGQTCRARRVGMEGLIAAGVLSEFDSLSSIVGSKHIRKVRGAKSKADTEEINTAALMKDGKALGSMLAMVDKCLPIILESPAVACANDESGNVIPLEDREPGRIYTDQIDMVDKFELFQWSVGTTSDLEPFRGPAATDVAGVVNGAGVQKPAKRAARGKR